MLNPAYIRMRGYSRAFCQVVGKTGAVVGDEHGTFGTETVKDS